MQTKNMLASKTIWGGIFMALAFVLSRFFGVEVTTAETDPVADAVSQGFGAGEWSAMISVVVGFVMVVWGRFTAKKKVTVAGG